MNLDGFRVITGNSRVKVTSVEFDSRKVTEGSLFVAVKGFTSDGHSYIKSALEKGASVIVADENDCPYTDEELKAMAEGTGACVLKAKDTRLQCALLSREFFGHPEKKLNMIGITGTKGKTTIAFMVRDILETAGKKSGLIGTVCDIIGDEKIHAAHTTPEGEDGGVRL